MLDDRLDRLYDEALKIVNSASLHQVTARLIGGIGIRLHTRKYVDIFERLQRFPMDIDLVSQKSFSEEIKSVMKSLGYAPAERFNTYHGHKRQLWFAKNHQIDIIFDMLEMSHTIDFRDRLNLDYPTLTPSDLLLTKLQVVNVNRKDIQDMVILLLEHETGTQTGNDMIDLTYLGKVLGSDWGFWYTANRNLEKVREFVLGEPELKEEEKLIVSQRTKQISTYISEAPKSFSFRMRAVIGTRKQWYNDVEEVIR